MTDETNQTTDESVEQPAATVTPLQLSDLLLAAQVIQLASSRGAFRPEEFTQIGGVYERIVTFLKDSGAISPAPAADSAPAEATDTPAAE